MATYILGISCFYHDSAAAIVRDGHIVAAAQEERFSRRKHDPNFPTSAINYCLEEAFIEASDLTAVVFYDDPLLTFDRIVKCFLEISPHGSALWAKAARSFLPKNFFFQELVTDFLHVNIPVISTRHHLSHAASAFFPSPFDAAAILTVDGVGEWATTSMYDSWSSYPRLIQVALTGMLACRAHVIRDRLPSSLAPNSIIDRLRIQQYRSGSRPVLSLKPAAEPEDDSWANDATLWWNILAAFVTATA